MSGRAIPGRRPYEVLADGAITAIGGVPIGYVDPVRKRRRRVYDRAGVEVGQVTSLAAAVDLLIEHSAPMVADENPDVAMHLWDSHRYTKTREAHAAGQFGVGPSDLGKCEKAIEFRERPPEGYEPVEVPKSAAIVGTLLHNGITDARRALYPWRQYGRKVDVPGLHRPGEVDEYDPIIGRVVDYKTASRYKWDRNGKDGPPESEFEQVMTYGFALAEQGENVTTVELLYLNRETGEWEPFARPYDEAFAKNAIARLHAIMDALEDGAPLPRRTPYGELMGPTVNTICARYCPAVKACWQLDEVPPNRTPEGYLLVQPDDDGTIEATLSKYDDARTVETAAKKDKDYAKTLVAGLEPGIYGEYTLGWTAGSSKRVQDPVARAEQLANAMRFAIDTDTPPPDPDELPYPETVVSKSSAIQVKRKRAAERTAT